MVDTSVPEWMTTSYLQDILRKSLKSQDLEVIKADIRPASSEGINYMSKLLRINIEYKEKDQKKNISVVAKIKIQTPVQEAFKLENDIFHTETMFFLSLLPDMVQKVNWNFAPKLYLFEPEHNVLLMEDLAVSGFVQTPVHTFLNKQESILGMQALAALHGASYYTLQKNPELKDTMPNLQEQLDDFFDKMNINAVAAMKKLAPTYGLDTRLVDKLLGFREAHEEIKNQLYKPLDNGFNVLAHSDCSKNNMMFSYKDGTAQDVKLLDFQVVSYNSFANDLHYFIFSSVQADVIVNNLDLLLEKYFEKLVQVAPDIPDLSLERIKEEFAAKSFRGFMMIVCFRAYILGETAVDFNSLLNGEIVEAGFGSPVFVEDIKKLLPFLDSNGLW